jgi:3-oxoadipate enol-lactonase
VPYADAGGHRLYYEIHGQGETLLCIAGLGLDVSSWRAQIPVWSAQYRMVVFDNRDAGRSAYASEPYEVRDLAADTIALADELELERFHLLGFSMGGAVAQDVALEVPSRVRSLTLCVSYGASGAWARERARLTAQSSPQKSDEELAGELMLLTLSEATYEELDGELEAMRRIVLSYPHRQRREGFLRQYEASARHEARERLPALRMPAHVIGAEQDAWVPVWKSRELAALIPGARLSIISGAAHAVHLERTREFNDLVLDFLGSAQSTPGTPLPNSS